MALHKRLAGEKGRVIMSCYTYGCPQ